MKMLMDDAQANLDLILSRGETVLHKAAAMADNSRAIRALLDGGADITIKSEAGLRPSMMATTDEIAELLEGGTAQLEALMTKKQAAGGGKDQKA